MKRYHFLFIVLFFFVPVLQLIAEPSRQTDVELRTKLLKQLREIRDQKLIAPLALSPKKKEKLIHIFDSYEDKIGVFRRANVVLFVQLKQITYQTKSEKERAETLLDQLLENNSNIRLLEDERTREIRGLLPPKEFLLLLETWSKVNVELQKLILEAIQETSP